MTKRNLRIAQNRFLGVCPCCGQPLKKMENVNILRCENKFCNGVASRKSPTGREPYVKLLSSKAMKTYDRLFKNTN